MEELYKKKQGLRLSFILYVIFAVMIFTIDVITPINFKVWLLNIFIIWGISRQDSKQHVIIITSICSVLIILGYFLTEGGIEPEYYSLLSRIFGVITIWILTFLLINLKQSERKFEESESRFRETFELAAVGITHILPDGKWLRFNKKFVEFIGYSRDELLTLSIQDITHPDDLPKETELKQALLSGDIKEFSLEKRYIRKDGIIVWGNITCSVMKEKYSGLYFIIVIVRDISDQKKLEEKLIEQTSEAEELSDFNLEILEYSPYGIASYEESGNCTYVNEAFYKLIGATRTQALLQNFHLIKSWKESGVYELAMEAIETGKPQNKELRIITTFGNSIWAEWRIIPFRSGGKLNLLVILNDITAYRKAERSIEIQKVRAEKLASISKTLSELSLNLDSILQTGVKLIGEITNDCVSIRLVSEDGNWLSTPAAYCEDENLLKIYKEMINNIPQRSDEGLTSGVIRTGMPVYVNNINNYSEEIIFKSEYELYTDKLQTASIMILPLIHRKNVLGVVAFSRNDKGRPYTDDEQSYLMEITNRIATSLANIKLYNEKITEIEERMKIEEALRESQESYLALFNTKTNGIAHFKVIINENGTPVNLQFIEVNNAYENIINLNKTAIEGKLLTEVFPGIENAPQNYIRRYGTIGIKGGELIYEDYFEPSKLWVSNYVFSPKKGKVIVIFTNITERKQTEEALQASEERFSTAFSANPNALVISNVEDGKILEVNETFLKLFNYTRKEVIGSSSIVLNMFVKPDDRNKVIELVRRDGKLKDFEVQIKTKPGEERIALISSEVLKLNQGKSFLTIIQDITERKHAETALRESEERQRLVLEAANLGTWDLDLINDTAIRSFRHDQIWGYTEPQIEWGFEIAMRNVVPEDRPGIIEAYERGIKSSLLFHENRVIWPDRSIHWIRAYGRFQYNDENKPQRVIGVVEDITDRKQVELALRESEERFRQLADSMPQIVWTADPEGRVDYYNQKIKEFEGFSQKEDGSWEWAPVLHEEDLEITNQVWLNALKTGTIYEIAHRVRLKDGNFRWHLSRGIPIKDSNGKICRWYGTATDIHEQKITQANLEKALRDLKLSEVKLIEAQKLAHVGSFAVHYEDNTYVEWTEEMFRIYGRPLEKGNPTVEEAFQIIHPDDTERVRNVVNDAKINNKKIEVEFRILLPDNKVKHLFTIISPLFDNTGKLVMIFGASLDITESKLQQQKLEVTLSELERSNKDLEQFAYTVSHDLQEPIRMIKSYSELISKRYKEKLDERGVEFLSFISEGALRMQLLVSGLLKYSRISTKGQPFTKVDCGIVLKEVLDDLRFKIQEEKAVINYSELPIIKGDSTQLRQVFQNLIQNALKFRTEKNNPAIEINCERKNKIWLFSVKDNGIGIEKEYLERIFIIFQRLHEREKYPGTGIGLAIVKKIIERHGGEVCVESKRGIGSVFYFSLPI